MIKTDEMYLENLTEFIYDEKRIVTFKYLSVTLGVHVNVAKQMLYTFYTQEKAKGKELYAIYFLSGFGPVSNFKKEETKDKGSSNSDEQAIKSSSQSSSTEQHFILLCPCSKLEETKQKFSKLLSVHVYSLSASPVDDFQELKATEKLLMSSTGKTPYDFGPYTCKGAVLREECKNKSSQEVPKANINKISSKASQDSQNSQVSVKSEPKDSTSPSADSKTKANSFFGKQTSSKTTATKKDSTPSSSSKETKQQKSKSSESGKAKSTQRGLGFLPVDKNSIVPESKPTESIKVKSEPKDTKRKSQNKKEDPQPRKRIRVQSNSDSEEDRSTARNKKRNSRAISSSSSSSSEESDVPDSPPRRKMQIIESDSDDDFQPKKEKSPEKKSPEKPVLPPCAPGRRRVLKVVTKASYDEDGYIITTKENVMESESDDENTADADADKGKVETSKSTSPEKLSKSQGDVIQPEKSQTKSNGTKSNTPKGKKETKGSQPKTKQQSITSFFTKK